MKRNLLGGLLLCIGGCGIVDGVTACPVVGSGQTQTPPAMTAADEFLDATRQNSHDNIGLIHDSPSQ